MKTNLITASKALQIMKDSSSIDKIMDAKSLLRRVMDMLSVVYLNQRTWNTYEN